jgi:hypothetical protein
MAYWDGERWIDKAVRPARQASRARRAFDHSWKALLEGLLISALVVGLVAGTAFAAKSGRISSGSYTATVTPTGTHNFGDTVYITTNAPIYPNNTGPFIWLKCYQGSTLVLTSDHAAFPSGWYYNWPFELGPTQSWSGGAADCTVKVVHQNRNKVVTDATTSFHVGG